jgi:cytochrome c oxidase subunit II
LFRQLAITEYLRRMKYLPLFALVLTAACSSGTATSTTTAGAERLTAISKLNGNAGAGKTLYESTTTPTCASCHKADGAGGGAFPGLAEPSKNDDVAELAGYIVNGVKKDAATMPAYANLSNQQIADIVAHMKATFGK